MTTHITLTSPYAQALITAIRDALESDADDCQITLKDDHGETIEMFLNLDNTDHKEKRR